MNIFVQAQNFLQPSILISIIYSVAMVTVEPSKDTLHQCHFNSGSFLNLSLGVTAHGNEKNTVLLSGSIFEFDL